MDLDVVVIGAGIAGLYAAYKLKQKNKRVLVIEASDRIGGRIGNYDYYGTKVVIGAGIGRFYKDKLLLKLLDELGLNYNKFKTFIQYSPLIDKVDILQTVHKIKTSAYYKRNPHQTFKEVGVKVLGWDYYLRFVQTTGYSDYENSDATDVINDYGFEDTTPGWPAFSVAWTDLAQRLSDYFPVWLNTKINKIDKHRVYLPQNKVITAEKIVIATTISSLRKLLPQYPIYNYIEGQPFLRMYAKTNLNLEHLTVVPEPIQKVIPIKNKVTMIAYNDNESSRMLEPYTDNNVNNRVYLSSLLKLSLNLEKHVEVKDIKSFYWDIGTHYYPPLPRPFKNRDQFIYQAQRPDPDIFVVGEVVAKDQGWTEGALTSVENVIDEI